MSQRPSAAQQNGADAGDQEVERGGNSIVDTELKGDKLLEALVEGVGVSNNEKRRIRGAHLGTGGGPGDDDAGKEEVEANGDCGGRQYLSAEQEERVTLEWEAHASLRHVVRKVRDLTNAVTVSHAMAMAAAEDDGTVPENGGSTASPGAHLASRADKSAVVSESMVDAGMTPDGSGLFTTNEASYASRPADSATLSAVELSGGSRAWLAGGRGSRGGAQGNERSGAYGALSALSVNATASSVGSGVTPLSGAAWQHVSDQQVPSSPVAPSDLPPPSPMAATTHDAMLRVDGSPQGKGGWNHTRGRLVNRLNGIRGGQGSQGGIVGNVGGGGAGSPSGRKGHRQGVGTEPASKDDIPPIGVPCYLDVVDTGASYASVRRVYAYMTPTKYLMLLVSPHLHLNGGATLAYDEWHMAAWHAGRATHAGEYAKHVANFGSFHPTAHPNPCLRDMMLPGFGDGDSRLSASGFVSPTAGGGSLGSSKGSGVEGTSGNALGSPSRAVFAAKSLPMFGVTPPQRFFEAVQLALAMCLSNPFFPASERALHECKQFCELFDEICSAFIL